MRTTADFLFEIGTEELPPKALRQLATSLRDGIVSGLAQANLHHGAVHWFATPRRMAVLIEALALAQPDREETKLGPALQAAFRDGEPTPAALGFARSCGTTVDQLEHVETDKGTRLAFRIQHKGQPTIELLPDIIKASLKALPVPKMMRWGAHKTPFVRPVHWLVAILGDDVVPLEAFELQAGRHTFGHRVHAPEPIALPKPDAYERILREAKVITNFDERKERIRQQAVATAPAGMQVIIDEDLLEEVTALVEWPVALLGQFDAEFLQVPAEALISSMQSHQKYFPIKDKDGQLTQYFVVIANLESQAPEAVIQGNEKVIRPRLADAQFFYETDKKQPLVSRRDKLANIVFQQKLGTLLDKTNRVEQLVSKMADAFGADGQLASRAAHLCKCDLCTEMVGEFPELQGIMGRYYARHDGEPEAVAVALEEQYLPRFSGDRLPATPEGAVLAVADRLDTLVGLFGIGHPPKGTKDPFALRRAAIGILRILMARDVALSLNTLLQWASETFHANQLHAENWASDLLDFLYQRFVAWYQDEGVPTRVIQAVLAVRPDVVADIDRRIRGVQHFITLPEADALAAAYKRVNNILEKQGSDRAKQVQPALFEDSAEATLYDAIQAAQNDIQPLLAQGDYVNAMGRLAALRPSVDAFFDQVMVMADDDAVRRNRLALLAELRALVGSIADISMLPA